jgi:co-chaperonin GroES (HSP10)
MKAVGNNLIIQKVEENITKSEGGLLLNKNDRSDIRYIEAKIISVGDTIKGLDKGNTIFYDRHAGDLKNLNLLKHYRIIRKWACKNNGLTDADLELLIYLDCIDMFTINDFKIGTYSYSWDNRRWNKLIQNDWVVVWRHRNRTTQKYNIYKVSFKGKQLIKRIYRIMLGEDDIPTSERRNSIMKGKSYIDKVLQTSIYNVNKDKNR